jgi:hypothetical protein
MTGDIFKPHRICRRRDVQKIWTQIYYRMRNSGRTFRQGEALFAYENYGTRPPHDLKMMPLEENDWFNPVHLVPKERLRT